MPETWKHFLTPQELVSRYRGRITERTLANWRIRGNGQGPKFLKIGGRVLYELEDVLNWESKRARGFEDKSLVLIPWILVLWVIHAALADRLDDLIQALPDISSLLS